MFYLWDEIFNFNLKNYVTIKYFLKYKINNLKIFYNTI